MTLSKRHLQILRRLRDEGPLDEEALCCSSLRNGPLYLDGLVSGYFKKYGLTRDDRYWGITIKGRAALAKVKGKK